MNDCYRKLGINIINTKVFDKTRNIDNYKGSLILLPPVLNKGSYLNNQRLRVSKTLIILM